jgi:D-arabinose 1-dehydrogenase-like Zn-dependent alcohol dehydrogenase
VAGGNGGMQAVMRVPADFAFSVPDGLSSADAAPLLCAGITGRWLVEDGCLCVGGRVVVLERVGGWVSGWLGGQMGGWVGVDVNGA